MPTHVLLQAGVGGMAAAVAAHARRIWGDHSHHHRRGTRRRSRTDRERFAPRDRDDGGTGLGDGPARLQDAVDDSRSPALRETQTSS